MKKYKGLAGAKGHKMGKAVVKPAQECAVSRSKIEDADEEIRRFKEVQSAYSEELLKLFETTKEELGQDAAEIFKAYRMIANDDYFFQNAFRKVKEERINIDYAIEQEKQKTCAMFAGMEDTYMRERGMDIENVCNELIARLKGIAVGQERFAPETEPFIVVAQDLTPADTVRLDKKYLRGFVTEKGGVTSHAVILAKTLGIPAVVGACGVTDEIENGASLYINGTEGYVVCEPDEALIKQYELEKEAMDRLADHYAKMAKKEARTLDGRRISVCVNAGDADSMEEFDAESCDGVGLFRTEFLYMDERDYPSEDRQFDVYREVLSKAAGKEVIIRTLDIGGDKQLDYMDLPKEENPFLGYRAIRLCLDRKEVFKTQLRALLRASVYGRLKIMFPMIVTLEELREAKALLEEAKAELKEEGRAYAPKIPTGIMVETPAAVLLSDKLAREADFFSIGTNDLIQYTTASDRMNEKVQYLYTPQNLSVLRAIRLVIENGHKAHIPVGMCGEAASDERLVPVLLGLGLDEFSMVPPQVGKVKSMICRMNHKEMEALAQTVLSLDTVKEVEETLGKLSFAEREGEADAALPRE